VNGRGKRAKGAAGERELAALLSEHLGFVVKRNLGQARDGADDLTVQQFRGMVSPGVFACGWRTSYR